MNKIKKVFLEASVTEQEEFILDLQNILCACIRVKSEGQFCHILKEMLKKFCKGGCNGI